MPERLLGADPAAMLDHVFATWPTDPAAISDDHRAAYLGGYLPPPLAAMCADYRASFHLDQVHDADDRESGRRITAPVLVVTGAEETQLADAGDVWREWASAGDGHDRARRPLRPRGVTGRAPRPAGRPS